MRIFKTVMLALLLTVLCAVNHSAALWCEGNCGKKGSGTPLCKDYEDDDCTITNTCTVCECPLSCNNEDYLHYSCSSETPSCSGGDPINQ